MKFLYKFIIVLIALGLIHDEAKALQDTLNYDEIGQKLDSYMRHFSGENPGAVISVMYKGDIIFKRSFGLSDVAKKEKMQTENVFNLENISKSFTSLAIMQLAEKGKINLDNNLTDIFNDFPDYGKNVKVKYLLNHTSGIKSYNSEEVETNDGLLTLLKLQENTVFDSGSKFQYSNSEYALLAKIIEEVSGLTYKEYLNKYIFKKLKIKNVFVKQENKTTVDLAVGHYKEDKEYYSQQTFSQVYGDQGIFMNAEDFSKWDKTLYTNRLLNCEGLSRIFTLESQNEKGINYYGNGWVLMKKNETRYYWHGGAGHGYTNMVLHLPDTDYTILVLSNRNDGYDFLKMAIYIAKQFDKNLKL